MAQKDRPRWNDFTAEVESTSGRRAPGCSVGKWLSTLTQEGRDAVEAALARKGELTTSAIGLAIRKRGADISDFTIGRHRRGLCSCEKNGQ